MIVITVKTRLKMEFIILVDKSCIMIGTSNSVFFLFDSGFEYRLVVSRLGGLSSVMPGRDIRLLALSSDLPIVTNSPAGPLILKLSTIATDRLGAMHSLAITTRYKKDRNSASR